MPAVFFSRSASRRWNEGSIPRNDWAIGDVRVCNGHGIDYGDIKY